MTEAGEIAIAEVVAKNNDEIGRSLFISSVEATNKDTQGEEE